MLLRAYLSDILAAATGGLFVFLGIITFGNPLYFDRLFLLVLCFTLFICRNNINIVGIVVLLVIQHICNEGAWILQGSNWVKSSKLLFYLMTAFCCYWVWYDKLAKLLLVMLLASLTAEIYWLLTSGKQVAIHWFVLMASFSLLVRDFIFYRVGYTEKLTSKTAESINLDWKIYSINALAMFLLAAMLFEYFLRHLWGINDALLVYKIYPYGMQIISTFTLWSIFHESTKMLALSTFRA